MGLILQSRKFTKKQSHACPIRDLFVRQKSRTCYCSSVSVSVLFPLFKVGGGKGLEQLQQNCSCSKAGYLSPGNANFKRNCPTVCL